MNWKAINESSVPCLDEEAIEMMREGTRTLIKVRARCLGKFSVSFRPMMNT